MQLRWLPLLISLFSITAQAYQFPTEIIERFDDSRVVAFISEAQFKDAKPWNPVAEAPPLTVHQAIQAVIKHYANEQGHTAAIAIAEIEIRKTPSNDNLWHYIIKASAQGDDFYYFVLMNGNVVPAVVEPESYK